MRRTICGAVLLAVTLVPLGLGCSHEAKAVGEAVIRTAASQDAANRFHDAGYPIKDGLTCSSQINGKTVSVHCSGFDTAGQPVTASGLGVSDNSDTALKGTWTGAVAGKEVFHLNCLGAGC